MTVESTTFKLKTCSRQFEGERAVATVGKGRSRESCKHDLCKAADTLRPHNRKRSLVLRTANAVCGMQRDESSTGESNAPMRKEKCNDNVQSEM